MWVAVLYSRRNCGHGNTERKTQYSTGTLVRQIYIQDRDERFQWNKRQQGKYHAAYTATKPAAEAARPTTFNVRGPGFSVQNIAVSEALARMSSHIRRPNFRPARESMSGIFRRRVGTSAAAIIACTTNNERVSTTDEN